MGCDSPQFFDIKKQPLNEAILSFAQQTRVSVIFPGKEYSNLTSSHVRGYYCARDALKVLLNGSGIEAVIDEKNQLILRQQASAAEAVAVGSVAESNRPSETETKKNKVSTFLSGVFLGNSERDAPASNAQVFSAPILEEIMVTGSRITRSGMETPTPVTALNARQLQSWSPDTLIESMNVLPQFLGNSSPETIGSATGPLGSSFLNLRGIGYNRTLVLLDGRRVAPSNRLGTPDIATLPQSIISNVEIITGGASAAYGSDAVSGVVNYSLNTDYSGFQGHVQYGATDRNDNERNEWSLTWGRELGERAHMLLALEYFDAEKVETYQHRDWYQNWGTVDVNGNYSPKVVAADVRSRLYTAGGLIRLPGSQLDMIHFVEGGEPALFEDGTLIGETRQVGGTGFFGDIAGGDVASKEQDQTGQGSLYPSTERGSAFAYLDYDFNSKWTVFSQLLYGKNDIDYISHGAHQETEDWRLTIYEDNAFLPESIRQIMVDENLESFPLYRYSSSRDLSLARGIQENETQSMTVGVTGNEAVRINAFYQYSKNINTFTARNFPRLDRLYKAMDVVADPWSGDPICRSTLSFLDDGCIPANPFGAGTMSSAAIDYILDGDMYRTSNLSQHFAELAFDTELLEERVLGPISVATGVTYRKETFKQTFGPQHLIDLNVVPAEEEGYRGLPSRFVGPRILQFAGIEDTPIDGGFDVWEIFAEGLFPIVKDLPFINSLDVNAAWRYADYSGSGGVNAWKGGIDWRFNNSIRFRLTRSRDMRAATLAEQFDRSAGGATVYDPALEESYVISQVFGGNPEVAPEVADTWTFGFVLTPERFANAAISVDWYDVDITDSISLLGTQTIVNECYRGAAELCAQVQREPQSNRIERVDNVYLNVAAARVSGVDAEFSYSSPISLFSDSTEDVGLRIFASYLNENSFTNYDSTKRDNAGTTSLPQYTVSAMLSYGIEDFTASLTGRYIGSSQQYSEPVPVTLQLDDNMVDSVFYLNLRFDYQLPTRSSGRYSIYANVINVLDQDPPIVATWSDFFGASAFVPGLHESMGRRYTLGFSFEF